jgi:energy-coupling factor transporter transmembrane protein EcfT
MYLLFGLTNFNSIDIFRDSYEDTIVDPFSYISLFSVLVSFILLFFSEKVFKLWLRKIVSWFLPVSVFLIWVGGDGNSYVTPDKTTYAIVLGFVLVAVTLVFALVQRFHYKR